MDATRSLFRSLRLKASDPLVILMAAKYVICCLWLMGMFWAYSLAGWWSVVAVFGAFWLGLLFVLFHETQREIEREE